MNMLDAHNEKRNLVYGYLACNRLVVTSKNLQVQMMCGSYQPANCRWRWCLLFVLWTCSGTVAWHHLTCLPESSSTSHSILGFREVLRKGKGCTSRGLSSTGQEVHVISLRKGRPANAQVTLMLAPNLLSRAPIFVLHSQQPVQWMLSTSPGKNWTFQVSLGSSISATQLVASAETDFPNTARGLLKWARRKHGGVTSLAEYHGVNTIYTRLGSGGTAQATCKLHRNFLTPKHFASERQLQPLRICQNPDPPQDLEVHIILSKGVAPRPRLVHLTVELHAVGRSPRQRLLLILKSEGTAQWMVRVHCFTGQLHVLASHKVTVSNPEKKQPLTVIQQTSPELANARDPLQYAAEQKLPVFTSYTEAERVNRFLLIVGLKEAIPAAPLENHELFGPMFLLLSRLAVERQQFPEAVTVSWENKRKEEDSSVLSTLAAAETEKVESDFCYGIQKPMHEKEDIKKAFSSEDKKLQDRPFRHVQLSLDVSNSEAFVKQPGFCIVSANSRVFVEASLITFHFCLGFTIQQCFISASSDSSVISSYLLIQHGCAADSHVNLLAPQQAVQDQASRPRYHQRQRLSFVLQPRSNHSIHFLHCRLILCNREPHDSSKTSGSIPKCQFENKACRREEPASGDFQRTITKPIMVTMETPLRPPSPSLKPDKSLANQQGKAKNARKSQKAQQVLTTPSPVLELPAVFGIAFSAFIIGISLTGGLWFIHSQTRKMAARKKAQLANEKAPEETAVSTTLDISSALNVNSPADNFLS
ncbi:transforming growth factor beta receptor type 3-like isoform X2 [Pantherophis guttatus]|uniref:Transforming growth factor beta receptor type 3-like isoform X2 n=1 Tax=Pantherophis guttatus TaxID=94885 RepID=A0A6P9AWK2_PANGU|nr:transforming growth factor beta receptor type 3-like isoform X2 [Pantherophis guttatus]